jgi:hypothetical protein
MNAQSHGAKAVVHACGQPTVDSDVELMAVMRHRGPGPAAETKIRLACPRSFPMDLIVRSPAEIRRLAMRDSFLRELTSNGIALPESDNSRVG